MVRLVASTGCLRTPMCGPVTLGTSTPVHSPDHRQLVALRQHYHGSSNWRSGTHARRPPLLPKRAAIEPAADLEAGGGKGKRVSVDEYITAAGGWGRYQTRLFVRIAVANASIGVDALLAAFMAPAVAEQWGLSLVQQQLLSSMWFAGALIGYLVSGFLADAWGRRGAIILLSCVHRFGNVLTFFAPSIEHLLLARALTSFGGMGTFNVLYPLIAEFSPPEFRAQAKQLMAFAWNCGVLTLVAFAFSVRALPWQCLSLAVLPGILATAWLLKNLPESPRFLWANGREAEAMSALQAVARTNGVPPSGAQLVHAPQKSGGDGGLWVQMLFSAEHRGRTAALCFFNFATCAAYYGTCFAPIGFGSGLYLGQLSATLLEVPACLLTAPLADKLGRRWSVSILLLGLACCLFTLRSIPGGAGGLTGSPLLFAAVLVARSCGQATTSLRWVVNAENFPTAVRGAGMALVGVNGALGGALGPLVFATTSQPFTVLGLLCLPAIGCMMSLPETNKKELS